MGNALKSSELVQRRATKAFTDPHYWDAVGNAARARAGGSNDPLAAKAAVEEVRVRSSVIDADEYHKEMQRVEAEMNAQSKVDPQEVSDALRMKLFQQRQYMSYKDTMMRLGVPAESVLNIDAWAKEFDTPMDPSTQDRWHLMADRVAMYELPYSMEDDPVYHDLLGTCEEGDNRLTERMLSDLMELKDEDKLDYDSAGKMLNRSPEVLRRICDPIRRVPICHIDVPMVDWETWLTCLYEGQQYQQIALQRMGGVRGLIQKFKTHQSVGGGHYNLTGTTFMENIPARGFQPPAGAQRQPPQDGPGYGPEGVAPN